jgi:hypothetical protein
VSASPEHEARTAPHDRSSLCASIVTLVPLVLCASCSTCSDDASPEQGRAPEATPAVWVRACIGSPEAFWRELGPTTGIAGTVEDVAAAISGVPVDQLRGEVDWRAPLSLVLFQPEDGRLIGGRGNSLAVVLRRPRGAPAPSGGEERRDVATAGEPLKLLADGELIVLSRSTSVLGPARDEARRSCRPEAERSGSARVEIDPRLLASQAVTSWVSRQGAWLEASAREATARRGRPTLGDPETLARMLARRLEETRVRTERAAPVRLEVTPSAAGLLIEASAARSPLSDEPGSAPAHPAPLAAIPPDAYLVSAWWSNGAHRSDGAHGLFDAWSRVAGDRLGDEERGRLEAVATRLAEAREGWLVVALRPALTAGPLVALAVVETRSPGVLIDALVEGAGLLGQGYPRSALEHFGARVELVEQRREESDGDLRFRIATPDGVSGERGDLLRLVLGPEPTLAWRAHDQRTVLVVYGPEPGRELDRLAESLRGETASILAQPVVEGVVGSVEGAQWIGYGQPGVLGALLTRGGPMAGGLATGGVSVATRATGNGWHAAARLGPEQVRALIDALGSEEER